MTAPKITNLKELELFIYKNLNSINTYIDKKAKEVIIPFYSSVDIREGADKLAPIDLNFYPAGFNNLCALDLNYCADVIDDTLHRHYPKSTRIGIIPESHTKNTFYLDNLAYLSRAVRDAGPTPYFVSFDQDLFPEGVDKIELLSHSKFKLEFHRGMIGDEGAVSIKNGSELDLMILNNDQSGQIHIDWKSLNIPVIPSPYLGWYQRRKSQYFKHYQAVVEEFCQEFFIDPSLLYADFLWVNDVDFEKKEGLERLAKGVDELSARIGEDKKIFLKGDRGTYGMGISVVSSGEEVLNFNRKARNKMNAGKNKIKFDSVLVQEGVDTVLSYDNAPAEITIYLIGGTSVGGFMRTNAGRDRSENLNSRGMVFRKFCLSELKQDCDHLCKEAMYSTVAKLATLGSGVESMEYINNK